MVLPRHFEIHTPERLFAVDLIRHVYSQNNITYLATSNFSRFGPYGDTPFRRNVRETIDFLRTELAVHIQRIFETFISNGDLSEDAFKIFVGTMALRMHTDEFRMMEFLEFSTIASSLALLLFRVGMIESGNCAVEAIVISVANFRRLGVIPDFSELEVFAGEFLEFGRYTYDPEADNRQGFGADPVQNEGLADSGQPCDSEDPKGPSDPKDPSDTDDRKLPGCSEDSKDPNGSDDRKGPSDCEDPKESSVSDDPKGPSGSEDPKDPSASQDTKEPSDSDDSKGPSDSEDPKDPSSSEDSKDTSGSDDRKGPSDCEDPKESSDSDNPKGLSGSDDPSNSEDTKEPSDSEDPKEPYRPHKTY